MKKLVLMLLFAGASVAAHAQLFSLGIKGGVDFPGNSFTISNGSAQVAVDNDMGWHAGIVSRINLMGFHIQPELVYRQYTANVERADGSGSDKIRSGSVDLPVLVGLKLFMLRACAGPVFNLNTGIKVTDNSALDVDFGEASVGYQVGLGLDLSRRISFDARYGGSFGKTVREFDYSDVSFKAKESASYWTLSLAYMFR